MNEGISHFPCKDKCCITSKLWYIFSLLGEKETEREGRREGGREREREHYGVMSQRGLKNDFNHIPMWLIVHFQGQKFDNNLNKSCDFVHNYFDICL